jgi:methionine-rich copper-binding protein CopC
MCTAAAAAAMAALRTLAIAKPVQMMASTPTAQAIVHGNNAQYVVRFDGPVNHRASRLMIVQGGHVIETLTPLVDSAVDVLYASGRVPPSGQYTLHWEAVSADGDTSSGDIPFGVQP